MSEPMTDEELGEHEAWAVRQSMPGVLRLVAELRRLRAENAALTEQIRGYIAAIQQFGDE